jgi:hypothetical protein
LGAHGDHYNYPDAGDWQVTLAHRWLHSDRHFIGSEEQEQRQEEGSQVVNNVNTFDLTAGYAFNKRFALSLTIPYVTASRSSLYEHDRTNRHSMHASGLGDLRLVGNYWLLNPEKHTNGNVAVGLGFDAPTGEYKETDYKFRPTGPVLDYVDNSIQPGDGGWGILFEFSAFQKVFKNAFVYANGTYLMTPEGQNEIGNSIWDAYIARAGLHYAIWPSHGLALSLGGRVEGVPPEDLVGDTEGRRRPGYALSIEPGISWNYKNAYLSVTAPVALYRNRQNYMGRSGDAAFADYIIQSTVSYRF